MSKYITVLLVMLACAPGTVAQEKKKEPTKKTPDFTGSWMLDDVKRKAIPVEKRDLPLKITHRDPELRITHQHDENGKILGRDFVYYTDGRGETNPATRLLTTNPSSNPRNLDKEFTRSTTRWSGNKLVTRATLRSLIAGHMMEFELIEERKLSADGNILTETSRTVFRSSDALFVPANTPELKRIYSRIPN